jgi:hypothetical protein
MIVLKHSSAVLPLKHEWRDNKANRFQLRLKPKAQRLIDIAARCDDLVNFSKTVRIKNSRIVPVRNLPWRLLEDM